MCKTVWIGEATGEQTKQKILQYFTQIIVHLFQKVVMIKGVSASSLTIKSSFQPSHGLTFKHKRSVATDGKRDEDGSLVP